METPQTEAFAAKRESEVKAPVFRVIAARPKISRAERKRLRLVELNKNRRYRREIHQEH